MRYALPLSLLPILPSAWATSGPCCSLSPHAPALPRAVQGPPANASHTDDTVASAWYPGWHASEFPPEKITWSSYNSIKYAFA